MTGLHYSDSHGRALPKTLDMRVECMKRISETSACKRLSDLKPPKAHVHPNRSPSKLNQKPLKK